MSSTIVAVIVVIAIIAIVAFAVKKAKNKRLYSSH